MEINGIDTAVWEDFYGPGRFLVSADLAAHAGGLGRVYGSNLIAGAASYVHDDEWSAIGILCVAGGEPWKAGLNTDDHGSAFCVGMHLCEMARGEADQECVNAALRTACDRDRDAQRNDRSWSSWHVYNGILFYDIGSEHTTKAVAHLESALSEGPLADEMRVSELERIAAEEGFRLPAVEGAEPDESAVFATYARMNGSLCPECGIKFDELDALKEHYGDDLVECFDCDEMLVHDGIGERPQCCDHCARERANASVAVEEERGSAVVGIDWYTCDGLVIRWNDGEIYRWDTMSMEWQHKPHEFEDVANS